MLGEVINLLGEEKGMGLGLTALVVGIVVAGVGAFAFSQGFLPPVSQAENGTSEVNLILDNVPDSKVKHATPVFPTSWWESLKSLRQAREKSGLKGNIEKVAKIASSLENNKSVKVDIPITISGNKAKITMIKRVRKPSETFAKPGGETIDVPARTKVMVKVVP